MTLLNDLKLNTHDLSSWGVAMPGAMADAMAAAQEGQQMRVSGVRLVDGRSVIRAETLVETQWFQNGFEKIDWTQCQCLLWPQCLSLIDRYTEDADGNLPTPPEWQQIEGASLGPVGAVNGWPVGAHVLKDGKVWVSRVGNNVNAPALVNSTWSRKDGTFVSPSIWNYQPGEELTEDGGQTWFRVEQATSFAPSASPSQYVEIDRPGGEPQPEPTVPEPWQPYDGTSATLWDTGQQVTHNGSTWTSNIDNNSFEPGVPGHEALWSVVP